MTDRTTTYPGWREGFVYAIINERTGRRYVGHTGKRVSERWGMHRSELRGGRHHNVDLQRDWDEDGETAFRVEVLARVSDSSYKRLEEEWTRHYILERVPLYNRVAGAKPLDAPSLSDLIEYTRDCTRPVPGGPTDGH